MSYVHKFVPATLAELGWNDPNAVHKVAPVSDELVKMFWIVNVSKYSELRKLEGCQDLTDLNATTTDCVDIMKMAKGLGVKDENIFRDEEATIDKMNTTYKKILN